MNVFSHLVDLEASVELCRLLILLDSPKNPLELLELLDVVDLVLLQFGRMSFGGLKSAKTLLLTSFKILFEQSFNHQTDILDPIKAVKRLFHSVF